MTDNNDIQAIQSDVTLDLENAIGVMTRKSIRFIDTIASLSRYKAYLHPYAVISPNMPVSQRLSCEDLWKLRDAGLGDVSVGTVSNAFLLISKRIDALQYQISKHFHSCEKELKIHQS